MSKFFCNPWVRSLVGAVFVVGALHLYLQSVNEGNRKLCRQLSSDILEETGYALAVGFDSNTVIIWGTVEDSGAQRKIAEVAEGSIRNFKRERLFSAPKLFNLVHVAGQPNVPNPNRRGLPSEGESDELAWKPFGIPVAVQAKRLAAFFSL